MGIYYQLKGKVIAIEEDKIALDVHNVTYEISISHPSDFALNQEASLFIHEINSEDDHYLIGFTLKEEKQAFLDLISVKGIGPKTALNALKVVSPSNLVNAIETNNISFLKKIPGIGPKAASQIILDLHGKLITSSEKTKKTNRYEEVKVALKSLGFKSKEIDDALASIDDNKASDEEVLRLALKRLRKGR